MLICRCEECKALLMFNPGEPIKCKCGGDVYFLTMKKAVRVAHDK